MSRMWKAALLAAAVLPAQAWAQDDHHHGDGGGHEQHGGHAPGAAPAARPAPAQPAAPPPAARPAPAPNAGGQAQGGFGGRPGGGYHFNGGARGQVSPGVATPQAEGRRPYDYGGQQGGAPDFRRPGGDPRATAPGAPGVTPQADGRRPYGYGGGYGGGRYGGDPRVTPGAPGVTPQADGRRPFDGRGDPRTAPGYRPGGYDARGQGYRQGGNDGRGYDGRGQGYRPGGYANGANRGAWNRTWRNDGRYDWNHYRYQNRAIFHLRPYYAPYGWRYGYRRFEIGVTLDSFLWGPDYWIDDPYTYRLPPADGEYRWVRYYNDALLVDIDSGEVVDVVHDIFD